MILRFNKIWCLFLTLVLLVSSLFAMQGSVVEADSSVISNLVLSKNALMLEIGDTASLTATAVYEDGSTENATVKTVWNSGSPDVASVYAGSVTAKKEGTAVITATYMGVSVIVNVTVSKKVRSLVKDTQSLDLRKGESQQVTLTAYYDDGSTEDVTNKADWNIDNGAVATVVNGKVTGQSSGNANITAKYNDQMVTIPTQVEIVHRVDPDLAEINLLLHGSETVTLNATYPDGTIEDVTEWATWESDNPAVADAIKGKITGYGTGTANITATYGTKSTTITVDVDKVLKLDVNKRSLLMKKNTTEQITLTATYPDGTTEDITSRAEWTTSYADIVSVIKGSLVAVSTGEATVTAKYGDKSVNVLVDVDVPKRLETSNETLFLKTGATGNVNLTATYADGTTEEVTDQAVWSAQDESIVSVVNGKVTAYKAGETIVSATFGGKTATVEISVDVPITIVPNKTKVDMQVGGYEQIILKALYSDGTEEDVAGKAEWTSDTPDVAEVRNGMIMGVGTGTATITASYGKRKAVMKVSVGVIKSLTTTSDATLSMKKGDVQSVDLKATYTDGKTDDVASDAEWSSSDPEVATVDDGAIKAFGTGKATITGRFSSKSVTLTVEVDLAKTLSASPTTLFMDVGEVKAIDLTAVDADGKTLSVTEEAKWSSSSTAVATVDKGLVTTLSKGRANITATYGGKSVTVNVEVGMVNSLTIDQKYISTKRDSRIQLKLTATLNDGSERDVTDKALWKSSNYEVADVADGLITTKSGGTATISAYFGGKLVMIQTVVDKVKYLKTDQILINIKAGETQTVTATATYYDQSVEDVSLPALWTTSDIRIIDVKDGVIRAISKGRAVITVTYNRMKTKLYVTVTE